MSGFITNEGQICTRCVLDSTVPEIRFDNFGECNFCKMHDKLEKQHPLNDEGKRKLYELIDKIKADGVNKDYNCIVGVSGGRDSTFTLYNAVKLGLKPLAVHFDNGWNTEIAVHNIKKTTDKLNVDLYTVVADWEEFKDLQISFLKASVSDAEVPTDFAILSALYSVADKIGAKYILIGHSFRTEGVAPLGWTYMDGRYLKSVQKKFGKKQITTFPILSMSDLLYYTFIKGIKFIHLPEYMEYNQEKAGDILERELDWQYYGGHHHESTYTYFFQTYLLPKKFNIDKRKLEYSALIRSNQMNRDEAIRELQNPYPYEEEVVNYTINKLGLTRDDLNEILSLPPKSFHDYSTYYPIIKALKIPIKVACTLKILPPVFYEKFLG